MRIALDLKTYGPTYAQFRLVFVDGPFAEVSVAFVLEPREREPEESPEELKGLGAVYRRDFDRGVLTRGEEILLVPPPAHAGDVGGMDMDLLCHLYESARVVVEYEGVTGEREAAVAEIADLANYWQQLSEAGIVDSLDPQEEMRATLDRVTRSVTRSLDGLADSLERHAAAVQRSRVRAVPHTPMVLTNVPPKWKFWRRKEREAAVRMRDEAVRRESDRQRREREIRGRAA